MLYFQSFTCRVGGGSVDRALGSLLQYSFFSSIFFSYMDLFLQNSYNMYLSNVFNNKKGKVADEKKVAYEKEKKYMMKIFLSVYCIENTNRTKTYH